jgi:hypothetical protein
MVNSTYDGTDRDENVLGATRFEYVVNPDCLFMLHRARPSHWGQHSFLTTLLPSHCLSPVWRYTGIERNGLPSAIQGQDNETT